MRNAETVLGVIQVTGELLEIERLTSSSGRGRRKSTRQGNSSAAYSTASPVRRGGSGDLRKQGARPLPSAQRGPAAPTTGRRPPDREREQTMSPDCANPPA